jgi:hypothetical protein
LGNNGWKSCKRSRIAVKSILNDGQSPMDCWKRMQASVSCLMGLTARMLQVYIICERRETSREAKMTLERCVGLSWLNGIRQIPNATRLTFVGYRYSKSSDGRETVL